MLGWTICIKTHTFTVFCPPQPRLENIFRIHRSKCGKGLFNLWNHLKLIIAVCCTWQFLLHQWSGMNSLSVDKPLNIQPWVRFVLIRTAIQVLFYEEIFLNQCKLIDHFRVHISLYFKARLSVKSLLWKSVFIHIEIGTNYHNKILHLDSLWRRDLGKLGNGVLSRLYSSEKFPVAVCMGSFCMEWSLIIFKGL